MRLDLPPRILQTVRVDAWRLILDPPSPAGYNMAVDEALADSCRRGASGPVLRLYRWDRPAVSLGYFQRAEQVVDLDQCRETGIAVVRRTTGGRAVYHRHEVTYSIVAPVPHPAFPPTIRGTYGVIARVLEAALVELGFRASRRDRDAERVRHSSGSPLCFAATSRNELTIDGKKVVGSAQRRWPNAFLQHGSILLQYDPLEASRVFPAAQGAAESVTALGEHQRTITSDDVYGALVANWERLFGVTLRPGGLNKDEGTVVAESSDARDLTGPNRPRIFA